MQKTELPKPYLVMSFICFFPSCALRLYCLLLKFGGFVERTQILLMPDAFVVAHSENFLKRFFKEQSKQKKQTKKINNKNKQAR